ncbi:MAG: hypothetical protein ACE5PV_13350 [Candidatus Poribacteria bacterium]
MVRRPVDLAELRRMRLRELKSMGREKIQQGINKAETADWKNDSVIARKIQQHQLEWGRDNITIEEFKEISKRIKSNPDSIIYTYIHDAFPHHRGYCFISPEGEVIHYRADENLNKSCHKPKDLEKYLSGRIHWIQVTRKGEIV